MSFFIELLAFMRERKKYWLWPIIAMMAMLGILLVFSHGSVVAPFIYAIF